MSIEPPTDSEWVARVLAMLDGHEHRWEFVRTDSDWWDGDETDVYRCECGATDKRYIPR